MGVKQAALVADPSRAECVFTRWNVRLLYEDGNVCPGVPLERVRGWIEPAPLHLGGVPLERVRRWIEPTPLDLGGERTVLALQVAEDVGDLLKGLVPLERQDGAVGAPERPAVLGDRGGERIPVGPERGAGPLQRPPVLGHLGRCGTVELPDGTVITVVALGPVVLAHRGEHDGAVAAGPHQRPVVLARRGGEHGGGRGPGRGVGPGHRGEHDGGGPAGRLAVHGGGVREVPGLAHDGCLARAGGRGRGGAGCRRQGREDADALGGRERGVGGALGAGWRHG